MLLYEQNIYFHFIFSNIHQEQKRKNALPWRKGCSLADICINLLDSRNGGFWNDVEINASYYSTKTFAFEPVLTFQKKHAPLYKPYAAVYLAHDVIF